MLKAFATAKGLAKLQCTELCTKDEGQDVSATNQANLAALAFCPRIWGTDGSLAMVNCWTPTLACCWMPNAMSTPNADE